jgi:hypothetical protein
MDGALYFFGGNIKKLMLREDHFLLALKKQLHNYQAFVFFTFPNRIKG